MPRQCGARCAKVGMMRQIVHEGQSVVYAGRRRCIYMASGTVMRVKIHRTVYMINRCPLTHTDDAIKNYEGMAIHYPRIRRVLILDTACRKTISGS
eukprot:536192-Karenia_brevis.AAC.1